MSDAGLLIPFGTQFCLEQIDFTTVAIVWPASNFIHGKKNPDSENKQRAPLLNHEPSLDHISEIDNSCLLDSRGASMGFPWVYRMHPHALHSSTTVAFHFIGVSRWVLVWACLECTDSIGVHNPGFSIL